MLQLSQPPPPQPPRHRKRDLYEDPSIFEHVDQQAITVAESEQTSYTELIDQLTNGLITDLEKARYKESCFHIPTYNSDVERFFDG